MSVKDTESIAEKFEKTFRGVMCPPGDWHAGLAMVQSIHNIFWDELLYPIKDALKWSHIAKDARNYYYQASRLIMFVYETLNTALLQTFVSERMEQLRAQFDATATDLSNENFLCHVAQKFDEWIGDLHNCDDNWLRMCSLFLNMARDFFTFVESYRSGDSIGIELGYQDFVAVWRALG